MASSNAVRNVVIVGGGSAGWLTAAVIAAEHGARSDTGLLVTVVESPDIPPIGVGEGTWPTMRDTLRGIGVSESDFIRECDASFKQGSRFDGWVTGHDSPVRVEIRTATRTIDAEVDDDGRFIFDPAPRGLVRFVFLPEGDVRPVITPTVEI